MVVIEDFEFELVSADEDSKVKFQEHKMNSKTYTEVEPDAEYYLSVRKVRPSSTILCCVYFVDGKNLGYNSVFQSHTISTNPNLYGVISEANGIRTIKALQFMKASFTTRNNNDDTNGGNGGSSLAGMGDIKMKVYEGIPSGNKEQKDWNTSFTASSIDMDMATKDAAAVTMKKNLRSGTGSNVIKSEVNIVRMNYRKGTHLYTVTVHYCAAPGLIAVGVLPKPPLWMHARMLHPAQTTAKEKEQIEKDVTKSEKNGKEILELKDDSDSDDDDDELKETDEKEKKRAKRVDI